MDAFKRYARNVGLAGGTNVIVTLKGFILIPILTKTLGAEFYGIYALIVVTISLLAPLCTLGLGYAIVRFLGPEKDKEKVSKGVSSILVVTSLVALAVSTPSFSIIKDYLPLALPILPISLCYWLINTGDRYVIGYFMGADAVGVYAAAYGLGGVVAFFYAPIATALLPAITGLYEDNKIQEVKTHLKY
ncbi:unnamed protein product, partial [marine sediment metagenome]